jgi:hypothetical protein
MRSLISKAIDLIKDQIDEIEEDGIPNEKTFRQVRCILIYITTWLAYYLKEITGRHCLHGKNVLTFDNDDMKVAH